VFSLFARYYNHSFDIKQNEVFVYDPVDMYNCYFLCINCIEYKRFLSCCLLGNSYVLLIFALPVLFSLIVTGLETPAYTVHILFLHLLSYMTFCEPRTCNTALGRGCQVFAYKVF
jgi:hypothetical protein